MALKLETWHIQVDLIETLAGELIHLEQSFNIPVVMVVKVSSTGFIKPHLQVLTNSGQLTFVLELAASYT